MPILVNRTPVEANAIILDNKSHILAVLKQGEANDGGSRVSERVSKGLAGDLIGEQLDEWGTSRFMDIQHEVQGRRVLLQVSDKELQHLSQPTRAEGRCSQASDHSPHSLAGFVGCPNQLWDILLEGEKPPRREILAEHLSHQMDLEDGREHIVVKSGGDGESLVAPLVGNL